MAPSVTCLCGVCAKCKRREYMREWYRAQPASKRQMIAKRQRVSDPETVRARDRSAYHRRKATDPEYVAKRRARAQLNNAVKCGKVVRLPCEVCGANDAHGHHGDYSKPLSVRWLCPEHHGAEHRKESV